MYVCLCNAITDQQIRRAAKAGVASVHELTESLGVASNCGSCADHAQSIINETNQAGMAEPCLYYPATA
jgi:bacterioferritin-associated ferredoxin